MKNQVKIIKKSLKTGHPLYHVAFWFIVTAVLTFVFGRSWGSSLQAFFFVCLLLPVVLGTSYFFNYFLVPRYLLKHKYFWFGLYFFYTLVISLYVEMWVLTFSFIYLANFELGQMAPNSRNTFLLAMVLYLVVFSSSFILMVQQLIKNNRELEAIRNEKKKMETAFLEITSNRKTVQVSYDEIIYIESLADYIKVHTTGKNEITSKERISALEEKLPELFIRIHRSFIVNRAYISGFNNNEIELGETILAVGRSYKKQALGKLKQPR